MSAFLLPGEIPEPPPVKIREHVTVSDYNGDIKVVFKSKDQPIEPKRKSKLPLLLMIVALGVGVWLVFRPVESKITSTKGSLCLESTRNNPPVVKSTKLIDTLDDLSAAFVARGVEPEYDTSCLVCFLNDTGRIRSIGDVDESFITYHLEAGTVNFEAITHIYRHESVAPQSMPISPESMIPLKFYSSAENDGDWIPVISVSYQRLAFVHGWETGVFRGEVGPFFKIVFHGVSKEESPRLGSVVLYSRGVTDDLVDEVSRVFASDDDNTGPASEIDSIIPENIVPVPIGDVPDSDSIEGGEQITIVN